MFLAFPPAETYRLFQPLRPSPPHILSLSWRASRNMSALDAYILLNFTYRFSHATSLSASEETFCNFATIQANFITLSLIQSPRILFARSNFTRSFNRTFSIFFEIFQLQFSNNFQSSSMYIYISYVIKCEVSFTD